MFKVQEFLSSSHFITNLAEIFQDDNFTTRIWSSEETVCKRQFIITMNKFTKYRQDSFVCIDLIVKGRIASKKFSLLIIQNVTLYYQASQLT